MADQRRPPLLRAVTAGGSVRDTRNMFPLRAQSVSLSERPRSKYGRTVRSADSNRLRFTDKKFFPRQMSVDSKPHPRSNVTVKQVNRKIVEKVPFAVSIQNLSIPMKYADDPKPRHSTSKPPLNLCNHRIDSNKTKHNNPPKQVSNKRLCQTVDGKETENKLLVQIREAEQVSDFERILNSNAILSERSQGQVWRGCSPSHARSASVVPRPRSAYSLYAVSQAYHYLFHRHEESLQPLIDQYRQANKDDDARTTDSLLEKNWFENLQDLSEFYEDDQALKKEVETITDRIIAEEVKSTEETKEPNKHHKYFNVNLADLFGLRVHGEGFSPASCRDDLGPSPDVDKAGDFEEEWRTPSMSANSDDRQNSQSDSGVDCLAQNLDSIRIDSDAKVDNESVMIALESEPAMPKEERVPKIDPPAASQRTLTRSSAVSQKSVEIMVHPEGSSNPLHRSKLAPVRSSSETQASGKKMLNLRKTKNSSIESTMSLPNQKSLEKKHGSLRHQKSVVAHSDITLSTQATMADDRKALREALYQGIFHRHRRTIFAVGSFLRMLRSKTSNYDSIRSDSDEI